MTEHIPSLLLFAAVFLVVLFLARSMHFAWRARRERRRRAVAERAAGIARTEEQDAVSR
ncbi:MAG: hypothetical protein R3D27_10500 [Hyphomicrobiaceae bacterium]